MPIRILTQKSEYTVDYPQAIEFAEQQAHIFWLPTEIEVEKDLHEIKTNFTEAEYHGVVSTLKLFTIYELAVGNEYWSNYIAKIFPRPDIQRMANCLSANTRFITKEGVREFSEFNSGDEVVVLTHTGEWKRATVKNFGKQQLDKICLKKGAGAGTGTTATVFATPNHGWVLDNGARTESLRVGDKLISAPDIINSWDFDNQSSEAKKYWCLGFAYGDGNAYDNGSGKSYGRVRLCGTKIQFAPRFGECGYSVVYPDHYQGDGKINLGQYTKAIPNIADIGYDNMVAFIIGLCDADAGKNSDNNRYSSIQVSGKEINKFVVDMLQISGIYIGNVRNYTGQQTNLGVRTKETNWYCLHNNQTKHKWRVHSIERSVKEEDVWCLEVDDNHSFVLAGGIVTGNCFSYFELNVHAPFYNKINEVLGLDTDEFYNSYLDDEVLKNRMEWIGKRTTKFDTVYDKLKSVGIFSMIEGAILYSNFAFLKHFNSVGKNKLVSVNDGINFSVNDETIHSRAGAWLYRTLLGEAIAAGEISREEVERLIRELIETTAVILEHEKIIIGKIFEKGEIRGTSAKQLTHFVESRLDICLKQLGISAQYSPKYNPIASWFYKDLESSTLHDFFRSQGSDYNRNWVEKRFTWVVPE
jgi:ribonucleotide reductase beta subunit family protein with ferritin-like domain